jgi:hypothetical protein
VLVLGVASVSAVLVIGYFVHVYSEWERKNAPRKASQSGGDGGGSDGGDLFGGDGGD